MTDEVRYPPADESTCVYGHCLSCITLREVSYGYQRQAIGMIRKIRDCFGEVFTFGQVNDHAKVIFAKFLEETGKKPEHIGPYVVAAFGMINNIFEISNGESVIPRSISKMRGKAIKKKRQLEGSEGTLWEYCIEVYFKENMRIQSPRTQHQYLNVMRHFREYLGHEPVFTDLTDKNAVLFIRWMMARKLAPKSIANNITRIKALWNWLAKKRILDAFPTFSAPKTPHKTPSAWTKDQIDRIFQAAKNVRGKIGAVDACDWWSGLLGVLWDTGERISAVMAIEWDMINFETGDLVIPAHLRKGNFADACYRIHADTLACIQKIRKKSRSKKVFRFFRTHQVLFYKFRRILTMADVKTEKGMLFHKMRRSVASHIVAAGGDATLALGHSSAAITKKSYIDPRIAGRVFASDILFRPSTVAESNSNAVSAS